MTAGLSAVAAMLQGRGAAIHRKTNLQRTCSHAETLTRLEPNVKRAGITRVADVTGLDRIGIPVVMVVRPNSRSLSVSQGKGATLTGAKVAGLMESLETFHAERITHPVILTRYMELCERADVVDPASIPTVRASRFHVNLPIPWVSGLDLIQGTPIFVPLEIVHTDFTIPRFPSSGCFLANTNGLAAGNSYLEAVNQGICEVIERDAVTLWNSAGRRTGSRIDLETIDDPAVQSLISQIQEARCRIVIQEITSDVGVPVFSATLFDDCASSRSSIPAAGGSGCHPDRVIACSRAILEAVQSRLTRIVGSRDDLTPRWFQSIPRDGRAFKNAQEMNAKGFSDVPNFVHEFLEEDLEFLVERLIGAGLKRIIAVDLTKPEFGIPVVRVVIPGLEGPSQQAGYIPGARAARADAC